MVRKHTDPINTSADQQTNERISTFNAPAMTRTCESRVLSPVFEVGSPSERKEDQQHVQVCGFKVKTDHSQKNDGSKRTRRENDGLDTGQESNAFTTVPVKTTPSGPRSCGQDTPVLDISVLRVTVLEVGGQGETVCNGRDSSWRELFTRLRRFLGEKVGGHGWSEWREVASTTFSLTGAKVLHFQ